MSRADSQRVRYKVETEKGVLTSNFERRGWVRASDDDWNLMWGNPWAVKQLFSPETAVRLHDQQICNHFPNNGELTRKDSMAKNIKRYRKEFEKSGANIFNADGETVGDFVPLTYSLPSDYALFIEEYKKSSSLWIVKPSNRAQGKGIFIVTKLGQISKWAKQKWPQGESTAAKDQFIISRYIEDPMLIGGKKFDLRLYVLVTSFRPLRAFIHREGFARFCTVAYNTGVTDLDNMFVHLTNVAVQKQGDEYNEVHGGKWNVNNLKLYLESSVGKEPCDKLFEKINFIIVHSLRSCQNAVTNDRHCFELYGYDMLVDSNLKPWLIEVNASPSLTYTTTADRLMKSELISDTLDIVVPPGFPDSQEVTYKDHRIRPIAELPQHSGFEVLVDDAAEFFLQQRERMGGSRR
eukprot:TRINITY_DN40114_c0_g1_i1.p1 TRINITY_DN40114_c0_g1~~TRINITY_DN40114_c0_g1_i1.p1  ORF type:complete len:407 (+),score=148.53 TRINITY_DN40114_c0_g1_i1:56-1276(+)